MRFAFFGSSLVSSYWNGACTYYRGIVRALHDRGHQVTFYEPDAYERQAHRDIADPPYATVVVYDPGDARDIVRSARGFDIVVKTSGVGVGDELLEETLLEQDGMHVFWDVDAPATLSSMEAEPANPLRALIPEYDAVLTYGGGDPVVERYSALGARRCRPIYNALDPAVHHPVAFDRRFEADVAFLGNRLPDREARVEDFFFGAAERLPSRAFLLGGNGWTDRAQAPNVRCVGHVGTAEHNAFNCTPLAVLNVTREPMARNGFSPATRVFEAAGAGACLITDAWDGIEQFLIPGSEVLVVRDGNEVASRLDMLDRERAAIIGAAAREHVLSEHTYAQRAELVEKTLEGRAV
jgi:spore maturation protein CgeB